MVASAEGTGGGWQLARPAEAITLLDAYVAVEQGVVVLPTHAHPPNQSCLIGRHLQALLEKEFTSAQRALEESLSQTSIADLLRGILGHDRALTVS
ncbi:Rrf2 family transcriptional regulator [Neomicrococcus aestuarii]|uniref:RrF2 family transcriptional regulator n=1 Tax=Neomicrococcus aestuarii TaxID=556325 RepID=UPI0018DBD63A